MATKENKIKIILIVISSDKNKRFLDDAKEFKENIEKDILNNQKLLENQIKKNKELLKSTDDYLKQLQNKI